MPTKRTHKKSALPNHFCMSAMPPAMKSTLIAPDRAQTVVADFPARHTTYRYGAVTAQLPAEYTMPGLEALSSIANP